MKIKFGGFICLAVLTEFDFFFSFPPNPQEMRFGASLILFQSKMRKVRWCCSSCPSKTSPSPTGRAAVTTAERTVRLDLKYQQREIIQNHLVTSMNAFRGCMCRYGRRRPRVQQQQRHVPLWHVKAEGA